MENATEIWDNSDRLEIFLKFVKKGVKYPSKQVWLLVVGPKRCKNWPNCFFSIYFYESTNIWKFGFYSKSPNWCLIFWKFFSPNFLHKKIKKTAIFFFFLDVVPNFIMWKYLYLELWFLLDISNWYLIFWKFFSPNLLHKKM